MKTTLLLSTLAVGLISATPTFAQYKNFDLDSTYPSYSSAFGFSSYAGAGLHEPAFSSSDNGYYQGRARAPRFRQIR
jgi:hypothetical protein